MKRINLLDVSETITRWKRITDEQIDSIFRAFVEDETKSFSGYGEQYNKILGIKFGQIHEQFYRDLKTHQSEDIAVIMHLAVEDDKINVVLESSIKGGKSDRGTTHYITSHEQDNGFFFKVSDEKVKKEVPKLGISIELVEQLKFNWITSTLRLRDLFYSFKKRKGAISNEDIKMNYCWLRAHRFVMEKHHIDIFKTLFEQNKLDSLNLTLHFGLNYADFMISEELFSLIIEIDNGEHKTFMDFVKACPPNC